MSGSGQLPLNTLLLEHLNVEIVEAYNVAIDGLSQNPQAILYLCIGDGGTP